MNEILQIFEKQGLTVENCIADLKNSPIFAGSLGSKELFHSNIWAFLIEHEQEFLKAFFPECGNQEVLSEDKKGVRREFHHMDLTIETETNLFVIENKIKSLPRKEQLNNYRDGITGIKEFKSYKNNAEGISFLLTGIPNKLPSSLEGLGWTYLNYYKIAENIECIAYRIKETNPEISDFALKYAEVVKKLWALLQFTINSCREYLVFQPADVSDENANKFVKWKQLDYLRISDVFQKLNFDVFTSLVEKHKPDTRMKCHTDFTRNYALSEFYYEHEFNVTGDKKGHFRIGVQIQEYQFRWYVDICIPNEQLNDREIIGKLYSPFKTATTDSKWFVEYNGDIYNGEKKISTPVDLILKTSMRGNTKGKKTEYCSFITANDVFLYQYFTLNSVCNKEELMNEVLDFMRCAKKVFNDQSTWQSLNEVFPEYFPSTNPVPVL